MGLPKVKETILTPCHVTEDTFKIKNRVQYLSTQVCVCVCGCLWQIIYTSPRSIPIFSCCSTSADVQHVWRKGLRGMWGCIWSHRPWCRRLLVCWFGILYSFYQLRKWLPIMALGYYFWVSSSTWFNRFPQSWVAGESQSRHQLLRRSLALLLSYKYQLMSTEKERVKMPRIKSSGVLKYMSPGQRRFVLEPFSW